MTMIEQSVRVHDEAIGLTWTMKMLGDPEAGYPAVSEALCGWHSCGYSTGKQRTRDFPSREAHAAKVSRLMSEHARSHAA